MSSEWYYEVILAHMRDLKKKHRLKQIAYSPIVIVLLVLIAIAVWRGVWSVYGRAQETQGERRRLQTQVEELAERKERLVANIEHLETRRGVEEEVREKYDVAKQNEQIVVILDDASAKEESVATSSEKDEAGAFARVWGAVVDFFAF